MSSIFSIFRPHFAKFSSEPIAGVMAGLVPDIEAAPPVNGSSMSEVVVIIMWNMWPRKAFLTPVPVTSSQFQCFPLASLLLAIGNPTVNYFSLDLEGAELEV